MVQILTRENIDDWACRNLMGKILMNRTCDNTYPILFNCGNGYSIVEWKILMGIYGTQYVVPPHISNNYHMTIVTQSMILDKAR